MRIDIISAVPDIVSCGINYSIVRRAIENGVVDVFLHDLHDYGQGAYKQIDDYQFGGGAGMVLMIEPIHNCIMELQKKNKYDEIIYLTPDAPTFNQKTANKLSLLENIIILCGHYKGVDQRVRDNLVTMELSIGDFVVTGGELPATIILDAVVRLLPGAMGDETSALTDSFQDQMLAPPVYTRPATYINWDVPEILTSGNFPKIEKWREEKALEKTRLIRPDLLKEE